jgi:two-component system cell cycle sensor histidine kinase PleC
VRRPPAFLRSTSWGSARRARYPWLYWAVANAAVGAAYFLLGWLVSKFFAAYGLFPAPIWLPAAIATVGAIAGGWRVFPGIFLGSYAANAVLFAPSVHVTAIISLTNALGPVVGAIALRWRRPEQGLFTSFAGAIWFLCCTTLLGLETGADDEVSEAAGFDRQYLLIWVAIAIVSIVLFLSPPHNGSHIRQVFPFLLVVPLSWVALRMSLRWAYTLVSLVAVTAAAGTVAGYGPFQDISLANPLQLVGLLVVVLAMNVLSIVALVSELHRAQRENRYKSMFLASTSHELKTPLNAILGFSSIIDHQALGPSEDGRYAEYVRIIHSAGEHLLALINGLGDLSKIEAGQFALSEVQLGLAEAIEEAVALLRLQADEKLIAVTTAIAAAQLAVYADEKALRQILLNLISNAVKFTPEGGKVEVSAELCDTGELAIGVRDTGIGIPVDALPRLYTPFERLHARTAPQIAGTGLGLCITRALVMLHGGTITVDSREGEGTIFTITLPAARVITSPTIAEAAD